MEKKFWERFEEAYRAWLPECADLADVARALGGSYSKMTQWRKGRGRPQRKVQELAELFEPLRARGCNPLALATYVYMGVGEMPLPIGGIALQPETRDPRREPELASSREGVVVILEAGINQAIEAIEHGRDARPVLVSLLRIVGSARQVGLAGLVIAILALLAADKAEAVELAARVCNPLPYHLAMPPALARILSRLLAACEARELLALLLALLRAERAGTPLENKDVKDAAAA